MRNTIAKCILSKAKENKDFILISGDAGLGVWDEFKVEFKEQYFNPGINEALCVGMASGLCLSGKKVVYYNIAPFVIMRPFEQVRNDICYQNVPVILVGTGSGITYMPSGMTHYAIEDITLALSMPNLEIFSPCDPLEVEACFEYAYKSENPSYIRIPKAGEPLLHKSEISDISKMQFLKKDSKEVLLITHSAIASEVLEAAKSLGASVATLPFINSKNPQILDEIQQYNKIFVIEEHFSFGGLGTYLSVKVDKKIEILGLENKYIHFIGNQNEARVEFGLDVKGILEFVRERL